MKTYENRPAFSINTERKHADVVTGATLTINLEDARGLLAMTSLAHLANKDFEESNDAYRIVCETSRVFLRDLAKRILYSEGPTTEQEELINKFATPEHESKPKILGKINIDSHE